MFRSFDIFTLGACSVMASGAFGAVFMALWVRRRSEHHLFHWGLSSWLYAGVLLALNMGSGRAPAISTLLFGLMGLSDVLVVSGIYSLDRERPFRPWMALPVLVTALARGLPRLLGASAVVADICEALGLAAAMGGCGLAILRDHSGGSASRGRKIAGLALLGYLPGYAAVIVIRLALPDSNALLPIIPMISDQLLLGILNLGLLAVPAERAHERLRLASWRDPLTGAWNREGLAQLGAKLLKPGSAMIAIDIDHFKAINDRHGHGIGDQVLAASVHVARSIVEPKGGALFRIGGDEFIAIVPECGFADAEGIAERLRRFDRGEGDLPSWTLSIGIALIGRQSPTIEDAMRSADAALYRAKALGRNRATLFAA